VSARGDLSIEFRHHHPGSTVAARPRGDRCHCAGNPLPPAEPHAL